MDSKKLSVVLLLLENRIATFQLLLLTENTTLQIGEQINNYLTAKFDDGKTVQEIVDLIASQIDDDVANTLSLP